MATRRIKFLHSYASERVTYVAGQEHDLDADEAEQLVAGKVAVDVETAAGEPPIEPPAVLAEPAPGPIVDVQPETAAKPPRNKRTPPTSK